MRTFASIDDRRPEDDRHVPERDRRPLLGALYRFFV
jgi:hypothetical protein